MSHSQQLQINQLKLDRDSHLKLIRKLQDEADENKIFRGWVRNQMHNGMTELATITVTKILEQGLEATVVKDTDTQIKELINE